LTSIVGKTGKNAALPGDLQEWLDSHLADEQVVATQHSDLHIPGHFGPHWLIITTRQVCALRREGKVLHCNCCLPLEEITDLEMLEFVGNGLLRAVTVAGGKILARFTHSLAPEMAVAAQKIIELINARRAELQMPGEISLSGGSKDQTTPRCAVCGVVLSREGVCTGCMNKGRIMRRMLSYVRPYWPQAVAGLLLAGLATAATLVPTMLLRSLLDQVLPHRDWALFLRLTLLYALCYVGRAVFTWIRSYLLAFLGQRVVADIRSAAYRHLQQLSIGFYDRRQTGQLMSRLTHDTGHIQDFVADYLQEVIIQSFTIIIIAVFLFSMSPWLAWLALLPIPFLLFTVTVIRNNVKLHHHSSRRRMGSMNAVLADAISGIRVVKAFAQEEREIERFDQRNEGFTQISIATARVRSAYVATFTLFIALGYVLVFFFGGKAAIAGALSVGTYIAFISFLWQFYGPVGMISNMYERFQFALTAGERVFELLDTAPEVSREHKPEAIKPVAGAIKFDQVTFGYGIGGPILRDISLEVAPGEMIGLVGRTGAGKTTLINLICRFYDPDRGAIYGDGKDLRDYDLSAWRSQIGMVLQEPFLFHGTIAENISYGRPEANEREIIEAARAANAHDFIMSFPDAYDTQVGERGVRLSGGERQRISIARAILHDPKILILDEATSAVDTETELLIQEAISRLVANRTTFAIAHRLSTLRHAHRIVVIAEGGIAEIGSHDELLHRSGIYARLIAAQTLVPRNAASEENEVFES